MSYFENAFKFTLAIEKGYANSRYDAGGETKWGISKAQFPDLDIKNLTVDDAKNIYFKYYWKPIYDTLKSENVAIRVFDMAVNSGESDAAMTLQYAVNHCRTFSNILEDGVLGSKTVTSANLCNEYWLLDRFRVERSKFYADLVGRDPRNLQNLRGWILRNYR